MILAGEGALVPDWLASAEGRRVIVCVYLRPAPDRPNSVRPAFRYADRSVAAHLFEPISELGRADRRIAVLLEESALYREQRFDHHDDSVTC
jgi:hypothetical protein